MVVGDREDARALTWHTVYLKVSRDSNRGLHHLAVGKNTLFKTIFWVIFFSAAAFFKIFFLSLSFFPWETVRQVSQSIVP